MTLYDRLADLYDGLFPVNTATLERIGTLTTGRRALDAGSATGGHALALADLGWHCLGIEPSARMVEIARAREAARRRKGPPGRAGARFETGDMLDAVALAGGERFDAILCLGNTLPHLSGAEAIVRFFGVAGSLLDPGGVLVLQLLNYGLAGPGFAFPDLRSGGWVFRRRYEADESEAGAEPAGRRSGRLRFVTELSGESGADLQADTTLLFPIRPNDVVSGLSAAGFMIEALWSDWAGSPFDPSLSPYLVAVARRPSEN